MQPRELLLCILLVLVACFIFDLTVAPAQRSGVDVPPLAAPYEERGFGELDEFATDAQPASIIRSFLQSYSTLSTPRATAA